MPVTRVAYGKPAPIWLERRNGQLRAAPLVADALDDSLLEQLSGAAAWRAPCTCRDDACATASSLLYACAAGHQGCALATNNALLPMMVKLHGLQKGQTPAPLASCV